MLKSLRVDSFYEWGNDIALDFSTGLTILTGDNGAGKTTLLNLIFNILNGDFETLNKTTFKKIDLELDVNDIQITKNNKHLIVSKIEVERIVEGLEITYFLIDTVFTIRLKKINFPIGSYTYELIFPEPETSKEDEKDDAIFSANNFLWNTFHRKLSDLVEEHKSLEFINLLRNNIIYFPTYRRIDSDIVHLLEQNYPIHNEDELYEINRLMNSFPADRRVVGVNDDDIYHLYKSYSESCRRVNSEGLNKVLKSFIQEMIISTYKNDKRRERKENKKNRDKNRYDKAPDQLIDLSKQLGIGGINESAIREYFAIQKKAAEISKGTPIDISVKAQKASGVEQELFAESLEEIIRNSLLSVGDHNNLIMKLLNLYDQHMKKVNMQLKPYEYLRDCFESFFKNKISLELEDYNLELSRPFETLSTGEKQLITILSYAALSLIKGDYKPLIIIDEPELSLHISWQMDFLDRLLELPDTNILLATHSPYIANSDYANHIWQLGEIDGY